MFPIMFLLFSFFEIYSLIWLGGKIGGMGALAWVLCSAALGFFAIRTQREYTANAIIRELSQGGTPQLSLLDAMMVFVGGILLILPGLFSDFLGVLLLIPFTRLLFRKEASRFMQRQAARAQSGGGQSFFFTMNSRHFGGGPFRGSGQTTFDSEEDEPTGRPYGTASKRTFGGISSVNSPYGESRLPPRQTEAVIIDAEVDTGPESPPKQAPGQDRPAKGGADDSGNESDRS